ncbi:MAG: flagellar protein FlaG [Gammaproteobacteria bacterium]|nr:flagellar protein FlaG [Gammaproteobacteria bacterium]
MADLNINAKLPSMDAVNGFVRENLVKPLRNSQKSEATQESRSETKLEERQEIASNQSSSDEIKEMSEAKLDKTISQLNTSLQNMQRSLEFSVDKDAGQIVINVKDKETDEVVRQIPSKEVLELAKNLHAASERFNERTSSDTQSTTEGVFLRTSV